MGVRREPVGENKKERVHKKEKEGWREDTKRVLEAKEGQSTFQRTGRIGLAGRETFLAKSWGHDGRNLNKLGASIWFEEWE